MEFWNFLTKGYWSESGIRIMVILSLILQIILTLLGNRRKYSKKQWLRLSLWTAYLYADDIAIVTLGLLSREFARCPGDNKASNQNYAITASWAPFLLLHLGGPDTMTAYSLEDNQLWRRHLLTLLAQLVVAGIVFRGAWSTNAVHWKLVVMTMAVFVIGVVKCGERIWVQWSGHSVTFKNSMFPDPDPGPNYARYMDEFRSKRGEGYKVSSGRITEAPSTVGDHIYSSPRNANIPDAASLQDAFTFFNFCKQMFADLILSVHDIANSQSYFKTKAFADVFKIVEVELGFIYDVVYTKAALIHTIRGGLLRVINFALLVLAFVSFEFHVERETTEYSTANVVTTHILLAGAVFLELYSLLLLLSSDWALLWLSKRRSRVLDFFHAAVSSITPSRNRRWSNSVGQQSLLKFCLESKIARYQNRDWGRIAADCKDRMHKDERTAIVENPLKESIFRQLLEKPDSARRETRVRRASWNCESAELNNWCPVDIAWSIDEAEVDESILLWHIATDLVDHSDPDRGEGGISSARSNSRVLSEYMLYLLLKRPAMLPNGIGQIRFQDTCAETDEFFEERKSITDVGGACKWLLGVSTEILPSQVKGDRSKSVLFDACRLAHGLRSLGTQQRWGVICRVWVEMLSYAAGQCGTNQHARQLCEGGELLTHVWLLMAHLGITDRFQISKGHVRAKLIVQ